MGEVLFVILLTAATGVGGLALGGCLAALLKRHSHRGTALLLSFTGGLMLCVVSLDMVPEAAEAAKGMLWLVPLFLVIGFAVTWLLNCWTPTTAPAAATTCTPPASCWRRRWPSTTCRWAWRWGPRWR